MGVKVDIPSPPQSESTDASSYESDLKEQGGVYGKTQGTPLGPGQHSATSFGNNLTPTYWSASQLLGEHELRKRDQEEYRQMLSSTLGAIHEYPDYDPHYGYYQPELIINSDVSSSTLGIINPSLQVLKTPISYMFIMLSL